MRRLPLTFVFLLLPLLGYAQQVPRPTGWVNDFAHVIDAETADKLTAVIEEVEQKTSTEIAVVAVASIAPYDEQGYARLLFDNWKPGKKGKDNGVLLLLAVKERRWRIETGYGVEGILPDGLCGEIGRNYMVPLFKEGRYGEGLYQGARAVASVIAQDAHVTLATLGNAEEVTPRQQSSKSDGLGFPLLVFIIIFVLIIRILMSVGTGFYGGGYYGGGSGGGGFGGGGGGFGGFGGGGGGGGGAGGGF